ncbi:trafficking protein-like protein particle complex subunit 2 [Radiomyces spectabilis]|uniref:trafficking protein-like protein particle complex subunit 2 n=1 Tax=Radiomyces spectabilis TaxID=64574 RepID=UPI00222078DB|nr:trafficking protein-like protein particle complex subunit 2 [Radiomyces spectabilis]KAI8390906.1 trafficking protein-like protein particle complex subunit 2 [Radiomyces spectabilis]
MSFYYYFAIVGATDNPIYEAEIVPSSRSSAFTDANRRDDHKHLNQFIIHAALDVVEEVQWNTQAMYLKSVDRFNEHFVSAFVTAANVKFMLLHDQKSEDSIKNFFNEVYELYIKILMNPFYEQNSLIANPQFDNRVKTVARRFL